MPEGNGDGVRRHFSYANVMSTLAVFLVLAGGTAMAAAVESSRDIARQSVKNSDIKRDHIKSNRLKDGRAVQEVDVVPESLTGTSILNGGIGTDDLADDSVGQSEIQTNGVGSAEIVAGSIRAAELGDGVFGRNGSPVLVSGGAAENGAYVVESATATCNAGEEVIGGVGSWQDDNNASGDHEKWIAEVRINYAGESVTIDGGNDSGDDDNLVAQAICLGT